MLDGIPESPHALAQLFGAADPPPFPPAPADEPGGGGGGGPRVRPVPTADRPDVFVAVDASDAAIQVRPPSPPDTPLHRAPPSAGLPA